MVEKLKILELFSGTESFSKVARERGHETFTVDSDSQFNPDLCKDILEVTPEEIPFKPDVIWASPPCTKFSVMTIYRNWEKIGKSFYRPKNKETIHAMEMVKKTLSLIKEMKPKFWFIENPRAMLRKQLFMPNEKRKTVTYCQYGLEYQKATDIWTNLDSWIPRKICSPKSPCHIRAPRGSRYGIQSGMSGFRKNRPNQKHPDISMLNISNKNSSVLRAVVPRELCLEIIKACENLYQLIGIKEILDSMKQELKELK